MKLKALILVLLLCAAAPAIGVTRYYLPSSGTPGSYPNYAATWTNTTGVDWVRLSTTKLGTAMINKQTATITGTGYLLNRVYVSEQIGAQTISGSVYGYIRMQSLWSTKSYVIIKVVSGDGLTVRGILYNGLGSNTWTFNTMTSRGYPLNSTVTPVNALEGDRVVIEVGTYKNDGASFPIINSFGDNSATDLPANETTTAANNPWVEFSTTITPMSYTKFYLPSTGGAPAAPAFTATWGRTIEADRRKMVRTKITSAFTAKGMSLSAFSGSALNRQYVSDPLKAQTISGKIRGQILCKKNAGPDNTVYNLFHAKVVSNDGSIVRGDLVPYIVTGATYFNNNQYTDRACPAEWALQPVTAVEGDRLVFEFGFQKLVTDNMTLYHEYGDAVTTDLPISETDGNEYCPWVELTGDIRMGTGGGVMIIQNPKRSDEIEI